MILQKKGIIFLFLSISLSVLADKQEKIAVLVIGTGRSGSSCLIKMLNIMGLYLGKKKHIQSQPHHHNQKGLFEHAPLYSFNTTLQKKYKTYPKQNLHVIDWSEAEKRACVESIKIHIQKFFKGVNFFGIKNPHISGLLAPYIEALQELGYKVKIVVALRDPIEVYKSFEKKDGNADHIFKYIATALTAILRDAPISDTCIVYFDDMLYKTEAVCNILKNFIPQLSSYEQVAEKINDWVDEGLKHQHKKCGQK